MSEDMVKFYVTEMCLAIHILHGMGYVHRDIKPDNFLIDRVGHLKLTDFGSSAKMDANGKVCSHMLLINDITTLLVVVMRSLHFCYRSQVRCQLDHRTILHPSFSLL